MIKRTPQEIADFFQCYVAMDRNGEWNIYENRPAIKNGMSFWVADSGFDAEINKVLLEVPADHDWTHLYEPQPCSEKPADSINKEASYSEKAPVSENKPDHTSEIYTEKEFKLIPAFDPARLEAMISDYLNEGFTLYGNPFVVEDRNYGPMIIQAMVRGI